MIFMIRTLFSDGLKTLLSAALLFAVPGTHAAPRVATSDWTVAETLTAMKRPPVSVADRRVYDIWVNHPPLPSSVREAGLRFQPNIERLHQIKPDFFVQSPWYASAKPQFEKIAPVYEIDFAAPEGINYAHTLAATRKLAALTDSTAAAEKLIADTEHTFAQARRQLAAFKHRPLAVVQFTDGRHLRIYGKTSMFQAVMDKVGMKNAWTGESGQWGFANIGIAELAKLPSETVLLIVKPHPQNTRRTLEKSALWQRLPFAEPRHRRILPPVWSYGALPSMRLFAEQLMTQLPSEKEEQPW